MPGILPMKVIKVGGTGSQSRIAQACDRCRSKKIRCDGVRPCCSQCANVGFECRTSDKLSRRAFPRGYTESLEERVRALESEVRDLKDLLDEKDEKIDVLSRIHSFSSQSQRTALAKSPATTTARSPSSDAGTGIINVEPSNRSTFQKITDNPYNSLSSTSGFAAVYANKLVSNGKFKASPSIRALTKLSAPVSHASNQTVKTPPRLVSDQLINIFFQEWAPLYPVVHRPTMLKAYEQYLNNTESMINDAHAMAQLNLIFGIAALSSSSRTNQDPAFFEQNWSSLLDSFCGETSIETLQCFLLAQIYCMTKGDYRSLLRYRALAVDVCHQLQLYQNQDDLTSNPLDGETRKKVFWCQYVSDRFSSALTGMPTLLREEYIQIEYPADVDDENVTETGFLPTLPGESTRISSALALFEASRILSKALEELYPTKNGHQVYVSRMRCVAEELDKWLQNLPTHLRLEFTQDKPSTNVTSSRSPLLSLVYYFIRSLIHRPAVCFAEENVRSPSVLALSDSSKHIIQILELLDERRLCLSFSINRKELVLFSGLGLLWHTLSLKSDSKLAKESQKLIAIVVQQMGLESSMAATEFTIISNTLVSLNQKQQGNEALKMVAPAQKPSNSTKKNQSPSPRPNSNPKQSSVSRRNTVSGASPPLAHDSLRSPSWTSLPLAQPEPVTAPHYQHTDRHSVDLGSGHRMVSSSMPYEYPRVMSTSSDAHSGSITMADWEYVLSDMDRGYSNIFTGIYGGKECPEDPGPFATIAAECSRKQNDANLSPHDAKLSPEAWSSSSGEFTQKQPHTAQSVLSYSGESMGSVEDSLHTFADTSTSLRPEDMNLLDTYNGIPMPVETDIDEFALANGWDRRLAV
ncbi:Transcription factor [Penicillium taxi]|uniref:Transcription factor n=1 Tax=Penicillium taxi TaxID=168475 RepID=UPI002544D690|nr:Transcription factor [Penicillium taxi]KAJ5901899.1 Transcription factor [Penicillium taxi]